MAPAAPPKMTPKRGVGKGEERRIMDIWESCRACKKGEGILNMSGGK